MKTGLIAAMVCMVALTGCSTTGMLTSTEPQQTIYTLRAVEKTDNPVSAPARVLEIASPSLPPGMDGDRIALFHADGQKLDYYAGARWSAPLRDVIQDFTRRSASAVLPYVVAVTPDQGVDADFRLQMKVNDLHPVYAHDTNAAPLLRVSVEFTLLRASSDKIQTSFTLARHKPLDENRLDAIIAGLEQILQEIEREAFLKLDEKMRVRR